MAELKLNSEEKSEYRSIFKATSLFGGVKVFEIIISILRSKIVAMLIGPSGVGIMGLLCSGISLVQSATQLGLNQSAVRDVSEAYGTGNQDKINQTITILRKLVWFTGILGALAMIVFSPLLSKSSFGDYSYIISFCCLSIVLLCNQISGGQAVLLQGTRKLKYLAKSSLLGQIIGFAVCIPMYWWWGVDGIVPILIIAALTSLALSWYFARKVEYTPVKVTIKEVWREGNAMIKMGLAMSASGILVALSAYILRSFISSRGGLDEVGLFHAGFSIMTTYVGLVFTAMVADYYPRLSAVNKDNDKCRDVMNQQAEIGILILAPLMMCCVIFIPFIVRILYSDRFLGANEYIIWAAGGMLFKMASWAISFIFVAKGETKLFILNETAVNIYSLVFQLAGYYLWGLAGVGIGYSLCFLCYFLQQYYMSHRKYGFNFKASFNSLFYCQSLLLFACIATVLLIPSVWAKYAVGSAIIILSGYISITGLDKRMGILSALKFRIKK